jgi:hypothetical protein
MNSYNTIYYWSVNCTDGEVWTNETYSFATLLNATFYSSSSDGNVSQSDVIYLIAQRADSGKIDDTSTYLWIGQRLNITTGKYSVYRGYMFFDTSSLPDDATIISATLSFYGKQDLSTNAEFNLIIQNGQPDSPHDPMNIYDYYYSNYSESGGYLSTTSFITTGYNNITLNTTGLKWINKTATTKLCVRSSRDIESTSPGPPMITDRNEYVVVYAQEGGASYIPKLHITYTT